MTPRISGLLASVVVLLVTATVAAQGLSYRVKNRVPKGTKPALIIIPREPLKTLNIVVERTDGKKIKAKRSNLKTGAEIEIPIKQGVGAYDYTATLEFTTSQGAKGTAKFDFDAIVAQPPKLQLLRDLSDVDKRRVVLLSDAPVTGGEMEVLAKDGSVLVNKEVDFTNVAPGQHLIFDWSDKPGDVKKISLKIFDPAGMWQTLDLTPFSVDIPHEEVVFDSGKSSFGDTEAKKLDRTLDLLRKEIAKHGADLQLRLYVAGYTDTVGAREGNIALSAARARAIATYFRSKGLTIPIYTQGFGEDVLAVGTKDNVDEARNRRALYILSNHQPPASGQLPRSDWKLLK